MWSNSENGPVQQKYVCMHINYHSLDIDHGEWVLLVVIVEVHKICICVIICIVHIIL